ncbi:MAG TPA: hypothetical protein VNZ61_26250, partial [Roseomonas sp.]|nr:hypothetical protein [Roseomonas sp.]
CGAAPGDRPRPPSRLNPQPACRIARCRPPGQQVTSSAELDGDQTTVTVLLTTHYLQEAEALCDRIAILADGQIVAKDTASVMLRGLESQELLIDVAAPLASVPEGLRGFGPDLTKPYRLVFRYAQDSDSVSRILEAIRSADLHITGITTRQPDLEEVFLKLVRGKP